MFKSWDLWQITSKNIYRPRKYSILVFRYRYCKLHSANSTNYNNRTMRTKQSTRSLQFIGCFCIQHKVNDIICTWCITATQFALYLRHSLLQWLQYIVRISFATYTYPYSLYNLFFFIRSVFGIWFQLNILLQFDEYKYFIFVWHSNAVDYNKTNRIEY